MLNRQNIRNAAILRSRFCKEYKLTGKHAFVKVKDYLQCLDCGKIVEDK